MNRNPAPDVPLPPRLPRPLHGTQAPSRWVRRWSALLRPEARVLDLACGHGRHALWFASLGHQVTAVDRDAAAIQAVQQASTSGKAIETFQADIENDGWPLAGRQFDAVVVTNYLWRPLFGQIAASLAPGGVLIYETFTRGQETIGKPSNSDFLLQPGELLRAFPALRVVGFEDGFEGGFESVPTVAPAGEKAADADAGGRFVQRIAAVLAPSETSCPTSTNALSSPGPTRYRLT